MFLMPHVRSHLHLETIWTWLLNIWLQSTTNITIWNSLWDSRCDEQTANMNESSPNECDLTKHLVHVWSWWWETTLQILSNYCHTTLHIINCTNNFTTYYNTVTSELTLSLSLEIILIILFVLILRVSGFLSWMVSWNISDHLYDYISELLSRYQVGKQATDKYTTYV